MTLRLASLLLLSAVLAGPAPAQVTPPVVTPLPPQAGAAATPESPRPAEALIAALRFEDLLPIMREEGLDYGIRLEKDLFPGKGGASWATEVGEIYDIGRMRQVLIPALHRELALLPAAEIAAARDFFSSPLGVRIVAMETDARRAQLDDEGAEARRAGVEEMMARDDPRLKVLERFIAANDLIESNVAGALNANAAFYFGLSEGGAFGAPMAQEDVLSEVWAQEPDIRYETEDWVYSYLVMAYGGLGDGELSDYAAFSETPAGRSLSHALFAAYDTMFRDISRRLGVKAARHIAGQDL